MSWYHTGWNFFYNGASPSSCTDHYTPVHSTTCNNPVGWHHATETFHCPHFSLYKLCITATGFLLGSWTLTMGPKGCPKMSVRNYSYLLRNNPQEHISHLPCIGSPLIAHTLAAHLRLHIQGHAKEIHELCENSTNTSTCYSGCYIPTECINHASSEMTQVFMFNFHPLCHLKFFHHYVWRFFTQHC